jgi:hypothetical protein
MNGHPALPNRREKYMPTLGQMPVENGGDGGRIKTTTSKIATRVKKSNPEQPDGNFYKQEDIWQTAHT